MFLDGMISEIGVGDKRDGVLIDLDEPLRGGRTITISGLSRDQLRTAARMLYHRVTIKIESKDDRAQAVEDQPAPSPQSNIDEATGIAKTGEI